MSLAVRHACTCNHKREVKPPLFLLNRIQKIDPTGTLTVRKSFSSQMRKRFRKLKALIVDAVVTKDVFGLNTPKPTLLQMADSGLTSGRFSFDRSDEKIKAFMDWLRKQEDEGILEITKGAQIGSGVSRKWTDVYVQTAYRKGLADAQVKLRGAGFKDPGLSVDASFHGPIHVDRVGLIQTRTYTGLKKITDEMDAVISDQLAEGMARGDGPAAIARRLKRVIEIPALDVILPGGATRRISSAQRAEMLARTEIIRAHHAATIQEYKNWGAAGVKVLAEWLTAGDPCSQCADFAIGGDKEYNGQRYYSLDAIESLIPVHPNCRCTTIPVDITD